MDDRVTPCYARDFLRQHKVYGVGRQLPRADPGHENDSILSENDSFFEAEAGRTGLIPLGINKHGIVVAQSVRKGAPLNPCKRKRRQNKC